MKYILKYLKGQSSKYDWMTFLDLDFMSVPSGEDWQLEVSQDVSRRRLVDLPQWNQWSMVKEKSSEPPNEIHQKLTLYVDGYDEGTLSEIIG